MPCLPPSVDCATRLGDHQGAVAFLLIRWRAASIREGVLLAIAVSLGGMAAGRLVSMVVDGPPGPVPWVCVGVELALMSALL